MNGRLPVGYRSLGVSQVGMGIAFAQWVAQSAPRVQPSAILARCFRLGLRWGP